MWILRLSPTLPKLNRAPKSGAVGRGYVIVPEKVKHKEQRKEADINQAVAIIPIFEL